MKIPHSIKEQYANLLDRYKLLEPRVSEVIERNVKQERWLYLHRLKTEESFYVKAQTRRWAAVKEDFLACTIVVENTTQINDVVFLLNQFFNVKYRKPEDPKLTAKRPESFVFDDLRLYLTLKERDSNDETANLLFECQVKTFLQHAWAIATHDLIYKPKDFSGWASARVAYQVKAMLEHAEVAIAEVESIARSSILPIANKEFEARQTVLLALQKHGVDLGDSPNRIVDNILSLLKSWGYAWEQVWNWVLLDTNNGDGYGLNQYRFSIYEIIIESIICHDNDAIVKYKQFLKRRTDQKILVPTELLENYPTLQSIGQSIEGL
jgi:ppGpp synthetase/RelA/SpoT-type nucleotidyltranferase